MNQIRIMFILLCTSVMGSINCEDITDFSKLIVSGYPMLTDSKDYSDCITSRAIFKDNGNTKDFKAPSTGFNASSSSTGFVAVISDLQLTIPSQANTGSWAITTETSGTGISYTSAGDIYFVWACPPTCPPNGTNLNISVDYIQSKIIMGSFDARICTYFGGVYLCKTITEGKYSIMESIEAGSKICQE